jgi:hypothetical protein
MVQTLKQMIGGMVSGRRACRQGREAERSRNEQLERQSEAGPRGRVVEREEGNWRGGRRENNVDGFGIERADAVPQLEQE